jgi:hypothetical protein
MIDPYLTMRQVADPSGWTVRKMRRFLIRAGIAEKVGADWVVADDRLREKFPAIYERVYTARILRDTRGHSEPPRAI